MLPTGGVYTPVHTPGDVDVIRPLKNFQKLLFCKDVDSCKFFSP